MHVSQIIVFSILFAGRPQGQTRLYEPKNQIGRVKSSGTLCDSPSNTTCGNWKQSGEGSAIVGHHDLMGLKDTRHMKSWNSLHGSRGCGQDQLKALGGAGLFYCFAAN